MPQGRDDRLGARHKFYSGTGARRRMRTKRITGYVLAGGPNTGHHVPDAAAHHHVQTPVCPGAGSAYIQTRQEAPLAFAM